MDDQQDEEQSSPTFEELEGLPESTLAIDGLHISIADLIGRTCMGYWPFSLVDAIFRET